MGIIFACKIRWAIAGCCIAVALASAAFAPGGRADAAIVNCAIDTSLDGEEQAFLTLLNNHRAQNGKPPLGLSYKLSRAAQWKSRDLGVNAYFAHDDLSRSWVQRIRDCGYGYNTYLGENIAAGISGAQSAFDLWKNSPGHNANMLGANYTTVGIGRAYAAGSPYGWYWTTEFGGVHDGWAAATGSELDDAPPPPAISLPVRERPSGGVKLTVTSRDAATIARVDFYAGGRLIGSDERAPFALTWRSGSPAQVYAIARYRDGREARSDLAAPLISVVRRSP